jgi:hypothetical protein
MEHSKMFKKVDKLENEFRQLKNDDTQQKRLIIVEKTKCLFQQVTEFMFCAEKKAGPMPYRRRYYEILL